MLDIIPSGIIGFTVAFLPVIIFSSIVIYLFHVKNKKFSTMMNFIILPILAVDVSYSLLQGYEKNKTDELKSSKSITMDLDEKLKKEKDIQNNIREMVMLFDNESINELKKEIRSSENSVIKLYSPGGYNYTIVAIDSIVDLLKENNKKIMISNFCYSMCADFIALIPEELLIKDKQSVIYFHKSSSIRESVPYIFKALGKFNDLFKYSFIYANYIKINSDMGYFEHLKNMKKTGGNKWIRCDNDNCEFVTI